VSGLQAACILYVGVQLLLPEEIRLVLALTRVWMVAQQDE